MPDKDPVDELLAGKKPWTDTVELVRDPEWADDYNAALLALEAAERRVETLEGQISADDASDELVRQLADAQAAVKAAKAAERKLDKGRAKAVATLTLQGVSGYAYEGLLKAHRPTKEQRREASENREAANWNGDTFPAALVSRCLVDPDLNEEAVGRLLRDDRVTAGEAMAIFNKAYELTTSRKTVRRRAS